MSILGLSPQTTEQDIRENCEFLRGLQNIKLYPTHFRDQERQVAVLSFSKREFKDDAMKKLVGLVAVVFVDDV